jgi:hypothetical protein
MWQNIWQIIVNYSDSVLKTETVGSSEAPWARFSPTTAVFLQTFFMLALILIVTCNGFVSVPVTGRERSRLPHLDSGLIDGGKVVSLTRRPSFTSQENSWYSFLLDAESRPGPWCGCKD